MAKRELIFNHQEIGCNCGEGIICLYDGSLINAPVNEPKYCLKVEILGTLNTKVKNIKDSKTGVLKDVIVSHDYKIEYDDAVLVPGKVLTCKDIKSFCCFACADKYLDRRIDDCLTEETVTNLTLQAGNTLQYVNEAGATQSIALCSIVNSCLPPAPCKMFSRAIFLSSNNVNQNPANTAGFFPGSINLNNVGTYYSLPKTLTLQNPSNCMKANLVLTARLGSPIRFREGGLLQIDMYVNGNLGFTELVSTLTSGTPYFNDHNITIPFYGFPASFNPSESISLTVQVALRVTNAPSTANGDSAANLEMDIWGFMIGEG